MQQVAPLTKVGSGYKKKALVYWRFENGKHRNISKQGQQQNCSTYELSNLDNLGDSGSEKDMEIEQMVEPVKELSNQELLDQHEELMALEQKQHEELRALEK